MTRHRVPRYMILLRLIVLLTLPIIACNIPQTAPNTPLTTNPPGLAETSTPAPTPKPTKTFTPAPTPMPSDLVWFGPNMGSEDFPELFSKPEQWTEARSHINVLKFFPQNLLESPWPLLGDNTLNAFVRVDAFRKLAEWGIAIDIDVGAVKEWGCTSTEELRVAKETIQNVRANGGVVTFLDMDEPYMGGELVAKGKTCGFTMEQSADAAALFIRKVKAAYPNILVGETEPYPYFSVAEIEQWILALEERGVTLAHFHLDVDPVYVRELKLGLAGDLRELSRFFEEHRIPFGVIFISEWPDAGSNCSYFDSTMAWIRTVNQAIGKTPHLLFQSWQGDPADRANKLPHWVPINLPENDPAICSHTRLILEGLDVIGQ